MMTKVFIWFALVILANAEFEFFKTENDHLDMDKLTSNVPELQAYMDCFLNRKPCTPLTYSYKIMHGEAVREACRRCNANQRYQISRFLETIKEKLPEEYWNFRKHHDPENKYFDALEKKISIYTKPDMELVN